MSDKMLESMARAIADTNAGQPNPNWPMWQEHARAARKAALECLREPSPEMIDAMVEAMNRKSLADLDDEIFVRAVLIAAIQHISASTPEGERE